MSEVLVRKVFEQAKGDIDFTAYLAAQDWLSDRGFSYGSSCREMPTAIKKGDWLIAKWKNLTNSERKDVDGLLQGAHRSGPITVELYVLPSEGKIDA